MPPRSPIDRTERRHDVSEIATAPAAEREQGLTAWGIGEREQGLTAWGIGERERELRTFAETTSVQVITPGSTAGEPLRVLSSIEKPVSD